MTRSTVNTNIWRIGSYQDYDQEGTEIAVPKVGIGIAIVIVIGVELAPYAQSLIAGSARADDRCPALALASEGSMAISIAIPMPMPR